jgi:hypothetical protein
MWSYLGLIPLSAQAVRHIGEALEPFAFDRNYGGWWDLEILADAKGVVSRSVDRYLRAIST